MLVVSLGVFGAINLAASLRGGPHRLHHAVIGALSALIALASMASIISSQIGARQDLVETVLPRQDLSTVETKVGFVPLVPTHYPNGVHPFRWHTGTWSKVPSFYIDFGTQKDEDRLAASPLSEGEFPIDRRSFSIIQVKDIMPKSPGETKITTVNMGRRMAEWNSMSDERTTFLRIDMGEVGVMIVSQMTSPDAIKVAESLRPYNNVTTWP